MLYHVKAPEYTRFLIISKWLRNITAEHNRKTCLCSKNALYECKWCRLDYYCSIECFNEYKDGHTQEDC